MNSFVNKRNLFACQVDEKQPSHPHQACQLEDRATECFGQTHLLIWDSPLEFLKCNIHVAKSLYVSKRDTEWVNNHRKNTEMHRVSLSHFKSKPNDDEGVY